MNVAGDSVLIIDPASNGIVLSNVDVTLKLKDGKVQSKDIKGVLTETEAYGISEDFMKRFARNMKRCRSSFQRRSALLPKVSPLILLSSALLPLST